jgi:hypothetical protein
MKWHFSATNKALKESGRDGSAKVTVCSPPDERGKQKLRDLVAELIEHAEGLTDSGKRSILPTSKPDTPAIAAPAPGSIKSFFPTASKHAQQELKAKADEATVRYFVETATAWNAARSPAFKEFVGAVAAAGPGYEPPSSETLRTKLLARVSAVPAECVLY